MPIGSTNNFSRKVRDQYNQNVMNKGLKIPAGVYRGIVVDTADPRGMGRVKVNVGKFYGGVAKDSQEVDPDDFLGAVWCRFMTPFGGTTRSSGSGGQRTYGMWGQPPDRDTEVLVAFSGDSDKGIVLGILPDESRNASMAGPQAGFSNNGTFTIVEEVDRTRTSENDRPPPHPQATFLQRQGLEQDRIRGLNFSNPRRENQSRVFGMSTPGGHSVVMDDGNAEDQSFDLVRIRTAAAGQILMDDTNGLIYIISQSGNTWIEMNRAGDLDVYSSKSINYATEGNFNVQAGGEINMESKLGFNMKSLGAAGIKMHASTGSIDIKSHSNLQIESESNGNLRIAGNWRETAGRIDMNGPPALAASTPTVVQHTGNEEITESISKRVPEHEPWSGHLDVQVVNQSSVAGVTDPGSSQSYYEGAPQNPTAGENVGAYDLGDFEEQSESDPTGLIEWRSGVDRRVNPVLIEKVRNVARRFGQTLTITSGYRSPAHNARVSGARASQHLQANAVDISGRNFSNEQRLELVALASAEGITGIGVYNDKSLHFDVRPSPAAWGSGFTYAGIPPYAKSTLDRHLAGGYA